MVIAPSGHKYANVDVLKKQLLESTLRALNGKRVEKKKLSLKCS